MTEEMRTNRIILKDSMSDLIYGVLFFSEDVDVNKVDEVIRVFKEEHPDKDPVYMVGAIEKSFKLVEALWYDVDDFKVLEV